ncbi:39S ribosomal protein L55, mitochondrial [Halotydeus destructor]|nr:39S ribosomal protein L55, mitochondrial [Halotydeus destructor]
MNSILRALANVKISPQTVGQIRYFNANRCAVSRIRRTKYLRHYPTVICFKDGSTITARHHEPRAIIKIPIVVEDLQTDVEKAAFSMRRKKMEKVEIKLDATDVAYDAQKYLKFMKK